MMPKISRFFLLLAFGMPVFSQVCSPVGKQCARTTDCCQGCCEAFTCVDRTFTCSTDMVPQPGYQTCANNRCPPDHICYLREVCPPENPCPRQPSCRRVYFANYTSYRYDNRNSTVAVAPQSTLFWLILLSASISSQWLWG